MFGMLKDGGLTMSTNAETYGWQSLGPVTGHRIEADALLIECGNAALHISPEESGTIRVRLSQSGVFGRDHSWAVVQEASGAASWQFEEDDEFLYLITKAVRVRIRKTPCRLSFLGPDGKVIAAEDAGKGMSWDGDQVRCWMRLAAEDHFFGLGGNLGRLLGGGLLDLGGDLGRLLGDRLPGFRDDLGRRV
ncbi:MAG: DUF4968 domain-containing protein, partial [Armatimonadetes bacterium]|nr:DUF4968 domain-containing protein [Armatimonadota bacterium]